MLLYNAAMRLAWCFFKVVWSNKHLKEFIFAKHRKTFWLIMGQQELLRRIRQDMSGETRDVLWLHAASYGEYNVIRPIIRSMRNKQRCIVVTMFSPSGYKMLKAKGSESDHVFYLPWDTQENVSMFLDIIKPKEAVFAISEYWINYLSELHRRHIPTYIVSMLVRDRSYLMNWYSRPIRKALKAVTTFMVLDGKSKDNLARIGFHNVRIIGDPLFDNAISISKEQYHNAIIERFCNSANKVFVAGSVNDMKDLGLVSSLANSNKDVKFIVVPHEISAEALKKITYHMEGKTRLYHACNNDTDFSDTQVLVVDFLGSLARIYRYGNWAYVGGGFSNYLHSVIEPLVYGIPVVFGPNTGRKNTPNEMIDLGIGKKVRTKKDLKHWLTSMDDDKLIIIKAKALKYVSDNSNFTTKIVEVLSR